MWAPSGAWFIYVAAAVDSRQQTYDEILNLFAPLERRGKSSKMD
jgi:hypothetical protein